jgi:serine/threonine protein kinase
MKNKNQYLKEIGTRKTELNSDFIIPIVSFHSPTATATETEDTRDIESLLFFSIPLFDVKALSIRAANLLDCLRLFKENAEKFYCISMPFAGKSLESLLNSNHIIGRKMCKVKGIFYQVLRCVEYLHSKALIHGK